MTGSGVKTCRDCQQTKPLEAFHRQATSSDGRRSTCKACRVQESADYTARTTERRSAYARAKYAAMTDEQRAAERERLREWKRRNRPWVREYAARPDLFQARIARYATRHGDLYAEKRRDSVRRRRALIGDARVDLELLLQKVAMWRDACWLCGGPWNEIDHVKPLSKGGPHLLANLRPICGPCNRRKAATWPLTQRSAA